MRDKETFPPNGKIATGRSRGESQKRANSPMREPIPNCHTLRHTFQTETRPNCNNDSAQNAHSADGPVYRFWFALLPLFFVCGIPFGSRKAARARSCTRSSHSTSPTCILRFPGFIIGSTVNSHYPLFRDPTRRYSALPKIWSWMSSHLAPPRCLIG